MKTRSEKGSLGWRIFRPLAIGVAVGAAACVLALLLMAALMASGVFPVKAVSPLALIAASIGAFAGGFAAARVSRERGLLYGAGIGGLLFLLTAAAGFAVLPDQASTLLLAKAALMIGIGALGGILGINGKRRR